jgi:hypothetical protein
LRRFTVEPFNRLSGRAGPIIEFEFKEESMKKMLACLLAISATFVYAQTVTSVVHGTIKKIDAGAKTIAIATVDGTEEVLAFSDKTIVHGSVAGAKDVFKGLKEGGEVAARYTVAGAKKTAVEVDSVGKGGMRVVEGTVTKVDAGAKTVVVKTADGSETVFNATEAAVVDLGKDASKAGKVTVHYTEEGGRKVVHFFKKL